jgi:hypothetical protein
VVGRGDGIGVMFEVYLMGIVGFLEGLVVGFLGLFYGYVLLIVFFYFVVILWGVVMVFFFVLEIWCILL